MKYPALLLLATLGCSPGIDLQAAENAEIATPAEQEKNLLSPAQLDELLAPIALYPDPLVAIILPAATFPTEVVMAARYLKANGDPEAIDDQPWDDSVKALARYPDVVKWMDENLAWTQQVGAAFLVQPAAVLTGTQRLRAAAVAAGNLKDTPQQTVVVEKEIIRIVPAEREVIYVPVYDPVWVYRPRPVHVYYPAPLITFSIGYRTGVWLSYGCDWGYNTVVVINRPHRSVVWHSYPTWHYPRPVVVEHCHVWRPAPARVQVVRRDYERRADYRVSHPTPNTHAQRSAERASAPAQRSVASSGSVNASSRPSVRRDSEAVSSPVTATPAPTRRTGPAVATSTTPSARPERGRENRRQESGNIIAPNTPATPSGSARIVRNPSAETTRPVVASPASAPSVRRPAASAPAITSGGFSERPVSARRSETANRAISTNPSASVGARPERTRIQTPSPTQASEARAQGIITRNATSSGRPERVRTTTTDSSSMRPSSSSQRPSSSASQRALPLPGATAEADARAARVR